MSETFLTNGQNVTDMAHSFEQRKPIADYNDQSQEPTATEFSSADVHNILKQHEEALQEQIAAHKTLVEEKEINQKLLKEI
jgi:hypothetical protein